jgi:hypothetical protein
VRLANTHSLTLISIGVGDVAVRDVPHGSAHLRAVAGTAGALARGPQGVERAHMDERVGHARRGEVRVAITVLLPSSLRCCIILRLSSSFFCYSVVEQRLQCDSVVIAMRFRSDCNAIPQRWQCDSAVMAVRFRSDCSAIP